MGKLLLVLDWVFLTLSLYILKQLLVVKPRHPLPPGPPRLPLIGSSRDWPTSKGWLTFTSWKEKYGDLIYANLAGTSIVIVNSPEKAITMLQNRSAIYSDRASNFFANEMLGFKNLITVQNDGPQFNRGKRLFAKTLGTKALSDRFAPMLEAKTREFIQKVSNDPRSEALQQHIRTYTSAIILDLTYGYDVKGEHDEMVEAAKRGMEIFTASVTPGAYLVDSLPWLAKLPPWFPGTGFMQEAASLRRAVSAFVDKPYSWVKDQRAAGTVRPSFVGNNLEKSSLTPQEEHDVKWTAVGLLAGGSDTTVSSIYSFCLFMTLNPEVQALGQAEVAAVIGHDRLPEVADRENLPYVNAIVKETFRLGPVTPTGMPHHSSADDVVDGFFIPKDTTIIPNTWCMGRDPQTYHNPEVFDPTRFMGDKPELDPRTFIFGFGRRKCPGRLLGDDSMFLACATILATLDISKARDSEGQLITPKVEYEGTIVTHPKPFPCTIKARLA